MALKRSQDDYDFLYKIVLIGDTGVGKSNILSMMISNTFNISSRATIGVEFGTKSMAVEDGSFIKAQIWDTAGQERYRAISAAYFRGAVGALLVYDITSRGSFEGAARWLRELRDHVPEDVAIVLVGNKVDLAEQHRQVKVEEACEFAEKEGMLFIETSAMEGYNITAMFEALMNEAHRRRRGSNVSQEDAEDGGSSTGTSVSSLQPGTTIVLNDVQQQAPASSKSMCCNG